MAFPLSTYSVIKDKYCILYLGSEERYITQLKLARKILESAYCPLEIYLCCSDELSHLLNGEEKTIKLDELQTNPKAFGYIREIKWNTITNPVTDLLIESGVDWKK